MTRILLLAFGVPALLVACAPDIGGHDDTAADTAAPEGNVDEGDGTTTTVLDATDYETWVYFELESASTVSVGDPESSQGWDLAFQRYLPKLNGGVSGSGGVEVAVLEGDDFDAITTAPDDGYVTDEPDADEDGVPEYAMAGWYDYDEATHVLSSKDDLVYVLRSVEGGFFKVRIESYYDDAGTPGFMTFRWGAVASP